MKSLLSMVFFQDEEGGRHQPPIPSMIWPREENNSGDISHTLFGQNPWW